LVIIDEFAKISGTSKLYFPGRFGVPYDSNEDFMTKSKPTGTPAVILFGLDKDNRPHAASFDEQSAKLAQKAAESLKFQILLIETPEQRELA
jgi:hypothetical protein